MQTVVRKLLRDQGRSQRWLATQVGVSPQRMYDILNRFGHPKWHNVVRIAVALGVPPESLLDENSAWRVEDEEEL